MSNFKIMQFKKSFTFLVFCSLAACGPMYQTDYIFTAPETERGQICLTQCDNGRSHCLQMEELRVERCNYEEERKSRDCERDIYYQKGREPKWYECGTASCSADNERCEVEYRRCFQTCGGKVEPVTRCVANCEKIPGYTPGRQP